MEINENSGVLPAIDELIELADSVCEGRPEELAQLHRAKKARADVAELLDAIKERRMISARFGKSTGIFAVSDERIDTAIAKATGADHA